MLYTRLATAPRSVHTAGLASYSANLNANLNPNPNLKLTSAVVGGLFPHAVFAPTPNPSLVKVPIRPWPICCLEVSLCGTFVPMMFVLSFFRARPHCLPYRHAVLSALAELFVWHRKGLVQSIVWPTTSPTAHPKLTTLQRGFSATAELLLWYLILLFLHTL